MRRGNAPRSREKPKSIVERRTFFPNFLAVLAEEFLVQYKPQFSLVKAPTPTQQQLESYVLTYQLLFIPSTLSPSMLENAILVP